MPSRQALKALASAVGFAVNYRGGVDTNGNFVLQQYYPGYGWSDLKGIAANGSQVDACAQI